MTETRHVKLDFEEALNGKKELLNSELNLLQIGKKMRGYKVLRRKELAEKRELKAEMGKLKNGLNLIISSFPEGEKKPSVQKRVRRIEREERKDFYGELDDIKKKLERLER